MLCVLLQTLLTEDSAQLQDEEGKSVIHSAAEQGKSFVETPRRFRMAHVLNRLVPKRVYLLSFAQALCLQ